jgi:hypothetical protein
MTFISFFLCNMSCILKQLLIFVNQLINNLMTLFQVYYNTLLYQFLQ